MLRPGAPVRLEIPVTPTGEIDGTVYLARSDGRSPAAGIELELSDASGNAIRRMRSEVDGFYLFDKLPPRVYLLRVSATDAFRLGAEAPAPLRFEITADGNVRSGEDLELRVR